VIKITFRKNEISCVQDQEYNWQKDSGQWSTSLAAQIYANSVKLSLCTSGRHLEEWKCSFTPSYPRFQKAIGSKLHPGRLYQQENFPRNPMNMKRSDLETIHCWCS
jgi:hypothetical protein